jgi:hypothetical protein
MSYGNDVRVCRFCGKEIFQKGELLWVIGGRGLVRAELAAAL